MKILIIQGANLNILDKREPIYGELSLKSLNEKIAAHAAKNDIEVEFFCSNFEGEIIERLQNFNLDALIINAGAFSHTSLAICDTLKTISAPKIEVHLTNIHARGRHNSFTATATDGVICGFKHHSYFLAIDYLKNALQPQ